MTQPAHVGVHNTRPLVLTRVLVAVDAGVVLAVVALVRLCTRAIVCICGVSASGAILTRVTVTRGHTCTQQKLHTGANVLF